MNKMYFTFMESEYDALENTYQNLTENTAEAKWVWEHVVSAIKEAGREDLLSNPTVLDLGGGTGEFSKYLNEQGVAGVSLDKRKVDFNIDAKQVRASAYKMPFSDGSFDIVTNNGFFDNIYHLDYPELLQEIVRILKNNGVLFIFAPSPLPREEIEKFFDPVITKGKDGLTLWQRK